MKKRLTLWLAFLGAVKGGRERVAKEINGLGVGAGINFRLGDGGWADGHATESNAKFWLESFGPKNVAAWMYSRPTQIAREMELWRKAYSWGVRRFTINAEQHWKVKNANELAAEYVEKMRAAFPDCELSHAPFAFRISHSDFPYVGFGKLDVSYDQLYVEEFGMSAVGAQKRYDEETALFLKKYPELESQRRSTVGDLYGSDLNRVWGAKVPGVWTQNSFDRHIDNSDRRGETDLDFYTIDAALAETDGTASKPWHALQKYCSNLLASSEYCDEEYLQCLKPDFCFEKGGRTK